MASLHSNVDSAPSQQSNHKKRRKIKHHNSLTHTAWTSQTEHRIYSSKLLHALRRNRPSPPSKTIAGREVRAAADRVLAETAKGRTRWSRAILASPLGQWKHRKVKKSGNGLMKRTPEIWRRLPAVEKKARVLGRLIPGCRKVSFPKLLEEASDYISALEMQVRAMKSLDDLLAGGALPPAPLRLS